MRTEEICQLFLEELLGRKIERIEFIDRQKDLTDSYEYHGIRLDVYIKDEAGTVFNMEMQSASGDDLPRRARYYQSGIDRSKLPKSTDYRALSESYIIFLCDFDYFHIGKAVGERVCLLKGTDKEYNDGSHVFFLNSRYQEPNASPSILEFLYFIRTNDLKKTCATPLGQKVQERIQAVRSDRVLEVSYMTFAQKMMDERRAAYEEGRAEGHVEGRAEGLEAGIRQAIAALKDVVSPDLIKYLWNR